MGTPQGAFAVGGVHGRQSSDDLAKTWANVLAELPLFAGVPKRHVRKIASLANQARFARGSLIVRAGEPGNGFFVILEGAASILRPGGMPPIPISAGSYFGEMALIDGGTRSASVLADTDVLCLRLSRGPFQKMLKSEPEVSVALLKEFARRIRELQARADLTS
jgi:CRP-like cAMP-binding protein